MTTGILFLFLFLGCAAVFVVQILIAQGRVRRARELLADAQKAHNEIRARADNYPEIRGAVRQAFGLCLIGPDHKFLDERSDVRVPESERNAWFLTYKGLSKEQIEKRRNFSGIDDTVEIRHLPLTLLYPLHEYARLTRPQDMKIISAELLKLSGYRKWDEAPKLSGDGVRSIAD